MINNGQNQTDEKFPYLFGVRFLAGEYVISGDILPVVWNFTDERMDRKDVLGCGIIDWKVLCRLLPPEVTGMAMLSAMSHEDTFCWAFIRLSKDEKNEVLAHSVEKPVDKQIAGNIKSIIQMLIDDHKTYDDIFMNNHANRSSLPVEKNKISSMVDSFLNDLDRGKWRDENSI